MSSDRTDKTSSSLPDEIESLWRSQPRPYSAVEGDVHRVILQTFATTGELPARQDLDPVVGASGRIAAADCSGALADCCCNYLNFFVDEASARLWWAEHPHIPGQILDQADAETLGVHLFGDLLEPYRREGF